jgi:hypothetical protein
VSPLKASSKLNTSAQIFANLATKWNGQILIINSLQASIAEM